MRAQNRHHRRIAVRRTDHAENQAQLGGDAERRHHTARNPNVIAVHIIVPVDRWTDQGGNRPFVIETVAKAGVEAERINGVGDGRGGKLLQIEIIRHQAELNEPFVIQGNVRADSDVEVIRIRVAEPPP